LILRTYLTGLAVDGLLGGLLRGEFDRGDSSLLSFLPSFLLLFFLFFGLRDLLLQCGDAGFEATGGGEIFLLQLLKLFLQIVGWGRGGLGRGLRGIGLLGAGRQGARQDNDDDPERTL